MAVTDAQFRELLRGKSNSALTLLAEIKFAYQTAAGPTEGTIYLADRTYRTKEGEAPANVNYRDSIMGAPDFTRSIDLKRLGGRGTMSVGSLSLNNADGSLDFLLDAIIDGREVRFYAGDQSWARADFRLIGVAVVATVKEADDATLSVQLVNKNFLLDDTIIGNPIGSGPNAGKPTPILLGHVKNFDVTPYLLDSAALTYAINNFPLHADGALRATGFLHDVRDGGESLLSPGLFSFFSGDMTANAGTDTLTHAAHGLAANDVVVFWTFSGGGLFAGIASFTQYWVIAAGLTVNDFRLSLTRGGAAVDITGTVMTGTWSCDRQRCYIDAATATLQLSSNPVGRVTIDMQAYDASGETVSGTPHDIFQFVLDHYTQLTASEVDAAAIAVFAVAQIGNVYYGRAITDRVNVLDILDEIALATLTWYAQTLAGVLTVGKLDLANLDLAASTDAIDDKEIVGSLSAENLALPWGRITLDTDPNVVVQTDGLLDSVTAEQRSRWGQPFQLRVHSTDPATFIYSANWWDFHKSGIDSAPIATRLVTDGAGGTNAAKAQAVVDEMTALFKPWTRAYSCSVGLDYYDLEPGACITLTYPRYGLDAGAKVRVMSVRPRFSEGLCDLVLVRQVTPDYATTSYP